MISNHRSNRNKKILLASILGCLIVAAGIYTFAAAKSNLWPFPAKNMQSSPAAQDINGPKNTQNASDPTYTSTKDSSSTSTNTSTTKPSTDTKKQTVDVGIASASPVGDQVEVRAFVSGVIEGDGTCTAVFTKDGKTVQGSAPAFIDATTSQCEPIDVPASQFPSKGTWSVVVTYNSPTSTGVSSALEVSL